MEIGIKPACHLPFSDAVFKLPATECFIKKVSQSRFVACACLLERSDSTCIKTSTRKDLILKKYYKFDTECKELWYNQDYIARYFDLVQ
ncbi:MAG: hypothetical protein ACI4R8_03665 [Candidatus Caccovivens sp.]